VNREYRLLEPGLVAYRGSATVEIYYFKYGITYDGTIARLSNT